MLQKLRDAVSPSKTKSLARSLSRLGWAGFWIQVVFGSVLVVGLTYFLVFRSATLASTGFPFVEYLTIADVLWLAFTTYWSYRYTKIAKRMRDPEQRPSDSDVVGAVWTGVLASGIGLLFSMIVLVIETASLLFFFLKSPQAGVPVIQTPGAETLRWVSSIDIVSLMGLVLMAFAELVVLIFSLWLLFRSTAGTAEYAETAVNGA
jgi:hypothetical protein